MSDQYDDEERRLADLLRQAPPEPPSGIARAEAARRYARRARRTKGLLSVGAAATVVAAIVVVPTVLTSGPGDHPAAGPTRSTPVPGVANAYTCPPAAQASGRGPQPGHGLVPSGAVLARICPIEPSSDYWTAPSQPMVQGLDHLVATVNGLPRTRPMPCPAPREDPEYTLSFQYPDGHLVSVTGQVGPCDLVLAGVLRTGAMPLLQTYLKLLANQLVHAGGTLPHPPTSGCLRPNLVQSQPAPVSVIMRRNRLYIDGAAVCRYAFPKSANPTAMGRLGPGQIRRLQADITAHATHRPPSWVPAFRCSQQLGVSNRTVITSVDIWGQRIDLIGDVCGVYRLLDRDGIWYWRPSVPVQRMLDNALHVVEPSVPMARLSGRLVAVGGPAGTPSRPLAGTVRVTLVSGGGFDKTVQVGRSGRFHLSVPPGRYRLIGYSPSYLNGTAACSPDPPVVNVGAGRPVQVNVACQEK